MNCKYTKDGRKVAVLGKLNSQEFIVQEIFVSGNQEVPGGENFVTKRLLDQPLESWKEKHLKDLEARFDRQKKEYETKIEFQYQQLATMLTKVQLRTSALFQLEKNVRPEQLETLINFMSGKITHFFIADYEPKIVTWEDNEMYQVDSDWGTKEIEDMKLISIFGNSNGDLSYNINQYRDGSGSWKKIIPCLSYEEAVTVAQEKLDVLSNQYLEGKTNLINLNPWKAIEGIVIAEKVLEKYNQKAKENKQKEIEKLKSKIAELESGME